MNTKMLLLGILVSLALLSAGPVIAAGGEMRSASVSAAADAVPTALSAPSCGATLQEVRSDPNWDAQLVNPVLRSVEEVRARAELYQRLDDCLKSGEVPVTGNDSRMFEEWINYFLTMAGSQVMDRGTAKFGTGYMVPFAQITDPAVLALRNEMKLPEPDGYVYIWLYPSAQDMPGPIKPFFRNPNVQGVTFAPRYIVALDPVVPGSELEKSQREWRSKVLSHELVHAYIRASLWPIDMEKLPTWYTEGIAIYFSDTANPFVLYDNQGRKLGVQPPDADYYRYRNDFLYLEKRYGRQGLINRIKKSLAAVDTKPLLSDLNIKSEDQLYALAEQNRKAQSLTRLAMAVGGVLGSILFIAVVFRVYHWLSHQPMLLPAAAAVPAVPPAPKPVRVPQAASSRGRPRPFPRVEPPLAQPAPPLLPAMIDLLRDSDPHVRSVAAQSLGQWAADNLGSRGGPEERARILQTLLPLLTRDRSEVVRQAVFAVLFWVGGAQVLRPLNAAVRGGSPEFQQWFVEWAAGSDQLNWLIELVPWLRPEARQSAVEAMRRRMTTSLYARLSELKESGDEIQRALAEEVLGEG